VLKKVETELKFQVKDVIDLLNRIDGPKPKIFYVKDKVYGRKGTNWKVRKRTCFTDKTEVLEQFEKTIPLKANIKKVLEEEIKEIPEGFECENSYEKIRFLFKRSGYDIAVDFYPIGIFCEIEGPEKVISDVAERLGFELCDNIKENVDTLYCRWAERNFSKASNRKQPLLHWGFGKLN